MKRLLAIAILFSLVCHVNAEKISALTSKDTLVHNDTIVIVDSVTGTTKKSTIGAVMRSAYNSSNVVAGPTAGDSITTGVGNVCIGWEAGTAMTEGYDNIYIGMNAGLVNTTGYYNTVVGMDALKEANITGHSNTVVGLDAMQAATGSQNVAIGLRALANSTGNEGVAVGYRSLESQTSGTNNTAVGTNSLYKLTTALKNTAFGYNALKEITTTTGGDNNTAVGYNTLQICTSTQNTAIGSQAGQSLISGTPNTFVGYQSGVLTTGSGNTSIGKGSLSSNTTGNYNTCIGQGAGPDGTNISSTIAIGYGCNALAANQLVIGGNNANGYINDAYIGSGITYATPVDVTINASGGSGDNIGGADLTIAGGKGTGTGAGGDVIIKTAAAGGAGSVLNSLTERVRVTTAGNVRLALAGVPVYANNAAALAGGLVAGDLYRTNADPDPVCIVH